MVDMQLQNFFIKPRVWRNIQEGSTLISKHTVIPLHTMLDTPGVASAKNQLDLFQYNTGMWQTDGQTDTVRYALKTRIEWKLVSDVICRWRGETRGRII